MSDSLKKYEVVIHVKSELDRRQLEELIAAELRVVENCQVYRQISVSTMPEPPRGA